MNYIDWALGLPLNEAKDRLSALFAVLSEREVRVLKFNPEGEAEATLIPYEAIEQGDVVTILDTPVLGRENGFTTYTALDDFDQHTQTIKFEPHGVISDGVLYRLDTSE